MRAFALGLAVILIGCSTDGTPHITLFSDVTTESGIDFRNQLAVDEKLNPYTYRNFFNGAGVAVGDINNDGLLDIYFAGNQADNKLYLNRGNFHFEDISVSAGVTCSGVWSTGVTMVDINADGLLDIYVCKSGNPDAPNRHNEFFINNGNLTFTDRSHDYGLDITGLSVQASFFDYDKDGDLDCYLLTNSLKSIGNFDLVKDQRNIPDPLGGGNKFFVNENGKFRDYSKEAGIFRSNIGFGLGITLGDFNKDTWTDVFVSNDFFERDYLYINDQKGAFVESLTDYFPSISMGSMGADFADLDNDGDPELFVTEMLPDSLRRRKTKTVFESWDKYQLNVAGGYHRQFSRNVLQKEIFPGRFAEVGRLANVAASEWSWGALLFDMDNDGLRDIFIANGIARDLLDRDYLTYTGAEENIRKMMREEKNAILKLIDLMPSSRFQNYALKNDGGMHFTNHSEEWGLNDPSYSNGSAYGDFDNDGDLDLVINNINGPSKLYRNNSDSSTHKSITIRVTGIGANRQAVGTTVTAYVGGKTLSADNFVTRGFQSSVQPQLFIGLGQGIAIIDSLTFQWPDAGTSTLHNVLPNQILTVNQSESNPKLPLAKPLKPIENPLIPLPQQLFRHQSSGLIDFNRDRLLPMMQSTESPALAKGDVDGDGQEEIYVGGGKDQPSMFIRNSDGNWKTSTPEKIQQYRLSEETKGKLFDADGDGDLDFYMANGGRFFPRSSSALMDRLFLNNGKGEWSESPNAFGLMNYLSTSVVESIDFDADGDLDLLLGERYDPFVYGSGGRAYVLENNGKGLFKDVTERVAKDFSTLGMVTDISVTDINGDGWSDVVLVGDWMPISPFVNDKGVFKSVQREWGLTGSNGWWHTISSADLNSDGKPDFVIGNHGLNSFFKAGDRVYISDFDNNGSIEQVYCTMVNGKYYPIADKDEFVSQLPSMRKSLLYYKEYASRSIDQLFDEVTLKSAKILQVNELASIALLSGAAGYAKIVLPLEAQFSPIYASLLIDFDKDGVLDVLTGGNLFQIKPQFGRSDASAGWLFKGIKTNGSYTFANGYSLQVEGQIRDIEALDINGEVYLFFAKHDDELEICKIRN